MSGGSYTFQCPACYDWHNKVKDSRTAKDGESIRRRRECLECGTRWSTTEEVIPGTVAYAPGHEPEDEEE